MRWFPYIFAVFVDIALVPVFWKIYNPCFALGVFMVVLGGIVRYFVYLYPNDAKRHNWIILVAFGIYMIIRSFLGQ